MLKRIITTLVLLLLTGCAAFQVEDFFVGYTEQMSPVRAALSAGNVQQASQLLANKAKGHNNYVLNLLEQGRISQLAGNYQQSKTAYELAFEYLEKEKAAANIRISSGVERFGALVSNDSAISYQVPAYEESMMHSYQAMNYLFDNQLEGALVEVRRANFVQEQAMARYEQERDEMEKAYKKAIPTSVDSKDFSTLNSRIGTLKNSIENAYTYFLSGVLYEASDQLNDAYIDYKRALAVFPGNTYVQQAVIRLAAKLSMTEERIAFEQMYNMQGYEPKENHGQLVVIYEQGLIDARESRRVDLPVFTSSNDFRAYSLDLPTYYGSTTSATPMVVKSNEQVMVTEQIVQLQALVAKQLADQMPSMITRQALRLVAKEQMRRELQQQGGDVGNILASLYNMASERADTRTWLTLPSDIQVMSTELPAGRQSLAISGVAGVSEIEAKVNPESITLVVVSRLANRTQTKVVEL